MKLSNHKVMWLADPAAKALDDYEADHGVLSITSAGRYEHEQQTLINRWHAGGKYNRPPYLYQPAEPAKKSSHVVNGGVAVDVYNWETFKKHCQAYGFVWYGMSDPVHFTYVGVVDETTGGYNPFNIPSAKGLQKVAKLYGYSGNIDDKFGDGSMSGFASFLRRNYGYIGNDVLGPIMWAAIARWLRALWRYEGNNVPGPIMRAALTRANDANYREL